MKICRTKIYFFICRDCGQKKRQKPDCEESIRPGICKTCYQTRAKYAPDESEVLKPN